MLHSIFCWLGSFALAIAGVAAFITVMTAIGSVMFRVMEGDWPCSDGEDLGLCFLAGIITSAALLLLTITAAGVHDTLCKVLK